MCERECERYSVCVQCVCVAVVSEWCGSLVCKDAVIIRNFTRTSRTSLSFHTHPGTQAVLLTEIYKLREGERERDRQRGKERGRERDRERMRDRQREGKREGGRERDREREIDREGKREGGRERE